MAEANMACCAEGVGLPPDAKVPATSKTNARVANLGMRTHGTEKNTAKNGTGTRK